MIVNINNINDQLEQNPNDIQLLNQKESQLNSLTTVTNSQRLLNINMKQQRVNEMIQIRAQNESIITNTLPAENQKVINKILSEMFINDNFVLNNNNILTIQSIANQCPLEGGDAVYEARSIISYSNPTMNYDDNNKCTVSSQRSDNKNLDPLLNKAQVFPNPANDKVNLILNDVKATRYIIFDLAGKEITTQNLSSDETVKNIEVSSLKSGMYILSLFSNDRKLQSIPLTVIK